MGKKETRLDRIEKIIEEMMKEKREKDTKFEKFIEERRAAGERFEKFIEEQRAAGERIEKFIEEQKKINRKYDTTITRFVDGLLAPCMEQTFKNLGIKIEGVRERCAQHKDGDTLEVDVLCIGEIIQNKINELKKGDKVIIVAEGKSFLHSVEVKEFVETKLPKFKEFFQEYKDYKIIGAIGGISLEEGVKKYGQKLGVYIFVPADDNLILINPTNFQPKIW
jgi:hypothetical protein